MDIQGLGYVGVRAKSLEDWTSFGTRFLGMQLTDRSAKSLALRMDDRKQRVVVSEDGGEGVGFYGWGGGGAGTLQGVGGPLGAGGGAGARRAPLAGPRRTGGEGGGAGRARLARARLLAPLQGPHRARRPPRQPPRDLP